jgi:hypothetical protein
MTKPIQVGDLVISHAKTLARAKIGRPALVIDALPVTGNADYIRLKVGTREWWDKREDCEKVSE